MEARCVYVGADVPLHPFGCLGLETRPMSIATAPQAGPPTRSPTAATTPARRLRSFFTLVDSRFEDLEKPTWKTSVLRDLSAGLVVAMTAIPMAMGFAIAMGLRPEQGIIAGALACIVGRTFGGSKYQVYGPTAAFIPLIASLIHKYGPDSGGTLHAAHGMLVFVSILAGLVLMLCGLFGLGRLAKLVPSSVVVGFTVGIAVSIALSNAGDALGFREALHGSLLTKVAGIVQHAAEINPWAIALALGTFALTTGLRKISVYIPAPAIALAICTLIAATLLRDQHVVLVRDRFGAIPTNFFVFTPPIVPTWSLRIVVDVFYYVVAIVFVSGVESLLCSSMADRLANNKRTPFNADKEFWGQGLVQIITPLFNGFPCTGALARTATSIKAGAVSPLAGYFKGVLKLLMAYFLAAQLAQIPLACIGGILLWVASNMIKKEEIKEVLATNRAHVALMIYTAVMVPMTDFLTGVLSALILFAIFRRFFKSTKDETTEVPKAPPSTRDIHAAAE